MSFPKKKSRKIIVNGHEYFWIASGDIEYDEKLNLYIISAKTNGQKLIAQLDYITPHIVRQVIVYGLKNGYNPEEKGEDLNLGRLNDKLNIKVSGQENTRRFVKKVEYLNLIQFVYSSKKHSEITIRNSVQRIIEDCNEKILNEKWFLGFKIMIENLHKIKFKIDDDTLNLIKRILENENIDWKNDFYWIDEFEIVGELFEASSGVFKKD
ncbi:hypothetical protein [uncultured Lacinutrix sp.]|uniref:hypothetical protein n=1 Tax=uncultured Lacinutrix sp. TaxID=574032 RepID=UPI0026377930|nr:hypothetical protein [uncultured Lacinutrix sp.]